MPRDDMDTLAKRIERLEASVKDMERDLDRKLTFREHMAAQIWTGTVLGNDEDVLVALDPLRIKSRPLGVLCIECREADTGTAASLSRLLEWEYATPTPARAYVRIPSFPGLDSATRYALTLLVLGG